MTVGPLFARTVRHFFPDCNAWLDKVPDPRCQEQITYHRRCLLWYGILLFVGKLGSRQIGGFPQFPKRPRQGGVHRIFDARARLRRQGIFIQEVLPKTLRGKVSH